MRGRINGCDIFHGPDNVSSRLTERSFNDAPASFAGVNGGPGMTSMMRTFRGAGLAAALIAALAVSACANKPGDNSMAAAGAATPDKQAQWLQMYQTYAFTIEGHADERGTREYNIALGARRAQAVRDYLIARGIQGQRMRTISYGKERPVAVCNDISCWSQNRRSVTVISASS